VFLPVFSAEGKENPGTLANGLINTVQPMQDVVNRHRFDKGEVEVFREAVIAKVAALQGCSSFERKARSQI